MFVSRVSVNLVSFFIETHVQFDCNILVERCFKHRNLLLKLNMKRYSDGNGWELELQHAFGLWHTGYTGYKYVHIYASPMINPALKQANWTLINVYSTVCMSFSKLE